MLTESVATGAAGEATDFTATGSEVGNGSESATAASTFSGPSLNLFSTVLVLIFLFPSLLPGKSLLLRFDEEEPSEGTLSPEDG